MTITDFIYPVQINSIQQVFSKDSFPIIERDIEENMLYKSLQTEKIPVERVILTIKNNGNEILPASKFQVDDIDKEKIKQWISSTDTYYVKDLFKIDLSKHILLVKVFSYKDSNEDKLLYGFAIENTTWNSMVLLSHRTSFAMDTFI